MINFLCQIDFRWKHFRFVFRRELGGFQDEFDGTHSQPDVPDDEVAPFTPEQARAFVREQVRLLYVCPNGALPPVEMALKLAHYCRRFPMMPELVSHRFLPACDVLMYRSSYKLDSNLITVIQKRIGVYYRISKI